jgi:acyl carrier protein
VPQENIDQRVSDVLWEQCDLGSTEILPRMSLRVDLGFDEDELIGVLIDLEDEFTIDVDDDEWERVQTVADAIELVKSKVEA